jgi:hypothetical protein
MSDRRAQFDRDGDGSLVVGTPLFAGLSRELDFMLADHRVFASGPVLLTYAPEGAAA